VTLLHLARPCPPHHGVGRTCTTVSAEGPGLEEESDLDDALNAADSPRGEVAEASDSTLIPWRSEGREPTVGEARAYFDAHVIDGGDPGIMEECERVLDATNHPTGNLPGTVRPGTQPSPFPRPTEDQLEEEGSD
jgi:hypothetical protein